MTQLEMMTTLVDAVRQMPETTHLRRAIFRAERRIEVLSARRARMTRRMYQFYDAGLKMIGSSFNSAERPQGTEHVVSFRVWRYPEATRPAEIDEKFPVAEGRLP